MNYFISYPRSGRAWFLSILQRLRDAGFPTRGVRHSHDDTSDHTIGRYTSDKRHWKETQRRLVILTRDPRDVVVSHWHILRSRTKRFMDKWGDMSLFEWIQEPEGLPFVIRFLNDWAMDQHNEKQFISYEGMHKDPVEETKLALRHWGLDIGRDLKVVHEVTLEYVRASFPHSNDRADPNSMSARRGEAGVWREYFNPVQVEWIMDKVQCLDSRYEEYRR